MNTISRVIKICINRKTHKWINAKLSKVSWMRTRCCSFSELKNVLPNVWVVKWKVLMIMTKNYQHKLNQTLNLLQHWNELYGRSDRKLWWRWLVCVTGHKRFGASRSNWTCRKCNPQVSAKFFHCNLVPLRNFMII